MSALRTVVRLGVLGALWVGAALAPRTTAAPSGTSTSPPLYLVDSTFDPDNLTRIFSVDPLSGALSLRADLGTVWTPVLGLAAASESVLYGAGTDGTCAIQGCVLIRIVLDPLSTTPLSVDRIGTISLSGKNLEDVVGLTFRNDGVLYAISESPDALFTIDTGTADAVLVTTADIDLLGGDITFDAQDRLWLWTNSTDISGIYRLDPTTGVTTRLDARPGVSLAGMAALGHTNMMFGASRLDDQLLGISPDAGLTGQDFPLTLDGNAFDLVRGDLDSPACANDAACDDGDACTNDTCTPGGCRTTPVNCDDGNACTDDSCDSKTGCVHANNTAPCSDGNACTTNDVCSGGECVGGPPPDCDDGNDCTGDSCNAPGGCVHAPVDGGLLTCGIGACERTVPRCLAGNAQPCVPGTPAANDPCNGIDDDCDTQIDEDASDADGDGVCDALDNCPDLPNEDQQDDDDDGVGNACDVTIASPLGGTVLDCSPAAARPMITWLPGPYDRYRVQVSWVQDFSVRITSGDQLLRVPSWIPGPRKWARLCRRANSLLYLRVMGVDRDLPRQDPRRKTYSSTVVVGVSR